MAIEFEDEQGRLAFEEALKRLIGNPQMTDVEAALLFAAYPHAVQVARVVFFRKGTDELIAMTTRKMLAPGDMTGMSRVEAQNYLNVVSMVTIIEDAGMEAFLERQGVFLKVIGAHIASGEPLVYSEELEAKLLEPLIEGRKEGKKRD